MPKPRQKPSPPRAPQGDGLPQWLTVGLLIVITGVLVYNVVTGGSEALSLAIVGGLFAAIGLYKNTQSKER